MKANAGKRCLGTMAVLARCLIVSGGAALVGVVLWGLTRPTLAAIHDGLAVGQAGAEPWSLERVVVAASAVSALIAYAVLMASTMATMVDGLIRRRHVGVGVGVGGVPSGSSQLARRGWLVGPDCWRHAILVACGLGLAAPISAGPLLAAQHTSGLCSARCAGDPDAPGALSGLPLPDLPVEPSRRPADARRVVVRPGDSLWVITEAMLAPTASDTAICKAVDRLYAANRATIGADPDLIFPGTELTTPGGTR